jgi:hypothetical protein
MQLLILFLISCKGCMSCWVLPPLPNVDQPDPQVDTGDTDEPVDTGDTGEVPDPPPYVGCTWPEDEPNNFITNPNPLELEEWACGVLGEPYDNDYFAFEVESAAWLRVWVRGSEILTDADPRAFILDEEGEFTATLEDGYLTSDIDNTFKLDQPRDMFISVLEQDGLSGDDYEWEMRISIVKPPVTSNDEEVEPNDSRSTGTPIFDGTRMFGRVELIAKYDWYVLTVEDEKSSVSLDIEAYRFGSPLNAEILVEDPAGSEVLKEQYTDASVDPQVTFMALEPGEYKVRVGACCEDIDAPRHAGLPYWYVLSVGVTSDSAGGDTGE